jgi:hypothetical protein
MPGRDRAPDAPKIDHILEERFQRGAVEQRYRLGLKSASFRQRPQTSEESTRSPGNVRAIDVSDVQIAPGTRKLPHGEIKTINVARQADRIDRAGGGAANDPERVGSTSWKNPCDGAQYTNLVRGSRAASTHDQCDARSLDVNLVRHDIPDEVYQRPTQAPVGTA